MDFTARYKKLNPAQQEAVDTTEGPVMVIAGPGTGKTELLSMRAANILKKTDTLPENILCLTFTESGANAMRQRLASIIGPAAYKIAIHTFHSFGTEIINQNAQFFYHGANFRPADELSSYELLHTVFDELEYDNPLTSKMNGEYTYLKDTLSIISELKKSGLTSDELLQVLDANDGVLDAIEPKLAPIFAARLSKLTTPQLVELIDGIRSSGGEITFPGIVSLSTLLADSLASATSEALETNSTKPITRWRNHWMKKDESGAFVLKSRAQATKLRAVSFVYFQYLTRMQQAELYDFDDMILRVVHAMEVFAELRFNLQEKYQYIMVDEFQDTNLAQMRILHNLAANEVSGGRPNIMVVGDDDQAIYSFQGADVGNINGFLHEFPATKIVALTDNYRSSELILSHAQSVIKLGGDRLENYVASLNKTLTARSTPPNTSVQLLEFSNVLQERSQLVEAISKQIQDGEALNSIAVLARRHYEIVALLPYFAQANIPVNYERRDNILELETIKLCELIATILVAIFEKRHQDANSLLPRLLAHPAFAFTPADIWKLSIKAQQNHTSWMELMSLTAQFIPLYEWLITQSQALAYTPLEYMLDEILGNVKERETYISPLMQYFFSPEKRQTSPSNYLVHLDALRAIRTKLREYRPSETPTLQSFLEFIRLHQDAGAPITSVRSEASKQANAISLMTTHKSKGLEFDHVYIIGAVDSSWGERVRSKSRLISFPENLPLAPAGDSFNERLRLFFVACTRAKAHLTVSYSLAEENGKPLLPASFLLGEKWQKTEIPNNSSLQESIKASEASWYQSLVSPLQPELRSVLAPMLENYKLSATHVCAFLDVSRGGPESFLIERLLRFPTGISASAAYGSAIHATLHQAHSHLSATGKHRPHEDILHDYEHHLQNCHLPEKEFHEYLQKGSDVLSTYLEAKYDSFTPTQKTELNFAGQAAILGEAHLTGTLDLVDIADGTISITDYKTGKPSRSWNGRTDYEKIKLHRYKQQLMFYTLLAQKSRDYSRYKVEKAILQFVEPTRQGEIIGLEATFSAEDLQQFSQLLQVVWHHITTLTLPDTSGYEPTYKGILAFENDLLNTRL
jgi:DNA helicase-2/ATP-dependent DNA helicase PcrA